MLSRENAILRGGGERTNSIAANVKSHFSGKLFLLLQRVASDVRSGEATAVVMGAESN